MARLINLKLLADFFNKIGPLRHLRRLKVRSEIEGYLRRAAVIGITWPTPDGLDDTQLERRLFSNHPV